MSKIQGTHYPFDQKNLAINGGMDYFQRTESATTTINSASTSYGYGADMFSFLSSGTTVKNYSVVQSNNIPTYLQSGFNGVSSYLFTMITGIASPAATDYLVPIQYRMEGNDYQRIHGKTVTFGFWVYASIPGTYSFALGNATGTTRSYVTTFTINAASTWQFVSITVTLDNTAGNWTFNNTLSLVAYIGTCSGANAQTSTLNTWQSGTFYGMAAGATNWMATSGATLTITQFSMTEGAIGLGPKGFQRNGKDVQQELALCQRYFEKSYDLGSAVNTVGGNSYYLWQTRAATAANTAGTQFQQGPFFKVTKRAIPTVVIYGYVGNANSLYNSTTANTRGGVTAASGTNSIGNLTLDNSSAVSIAQDAVLIIHWTAEAGL